MSTEAVVSPTRRWIPSFLPEGASLPEDVWHRRHLGIVALLWAHGLIIPVFAVARGFPLWHAVIETLFVPIAAGVATWSTLSRRTRTAVTSLGLLMSSAVLVHLSGGVVEMHFHFFVMVAAVALYQDWIPFLAAIAFVFVHHGVFGTLDPDGVFNHMPAIESPWKWAGIHAFFISGISAVCLVTWGLNERTLAQRKAAEDRLREETRIVETLNRIGRGLAAELDTQRVLQVVTDAATEVTGAGFGAFFYNVVAADGEKYLLYTLSGAPVEAFSKLGLPRNTEIFGPTFAGEAPVRIDDVLADPRYGKMAPHYGMPKGHLPVRSYLAVPVRSRTGEVLGGLFFGHPEPARFDEADERITVGIAAQAAIALDNARLYELEREARATAEQARDALTLLTDASRALTSSLELPTILRGVASVVVRSIADQCVIDLVDEEGGFERMTNVVAGAGGAVDDHAGAFVHLGWAPPEPGDESNPVVVSVRMRETQVVSLDPAGGAAAGGTAIVVPLVGRHRVLGALTLAAQATTDLSALDGHVAVAEELGRRAASAIENAQLYARQRTVAETLQHSLLPERMPEIPGIEAAARYIAGADVEVGGDWYDVIQLPRGDLAITMGDVVGRGERAASFMGQLRNATRAYALDGKTPEQIATGLNALLLDAGPEHMATMIYAVLDPEHGEIRLVNAGHPPPLLVHDGGATYVESGGGVPLGATQTARYHEERIRFAPGTTIVLYTDGLVEDRSEPLQDGLDRLQGAVLAGSADLEELCGQILDSSLRGRHVKDDTALLAVRLQPLDAHLLLRLPSEPSVLTPLRSTLRRWLADAGATEQEAYELLVAAGEACSNAIRHATGPSSSQFEVEASRNGRIEISVRDTGRWRERPTAGGGRGLGIIENFVDECDISRSDGGTEVRMRRSLQAMAAGVR